MKGPKGPDDGTAQITEPYDLKGVHDASEAVRSSGSKKGAGVQTEIGNGQSVDMTGPLAAADAEGLLLHQPGGADTLMAAGETAAKDNQQMAKAIGDVGAI